MYHPIPLLILHNNSTLNLSDSEIEYLLLGDDNEKFFSLSIKQWETCIHLKHTKFVKVINPLTTNRDQTFVKYQF